VRRLGFLPAAALGALPGGFTRFVFWNAYLLTRRELPDRPSRCCCCCSWSGREAAPRGGAAGRPGARLLNLQRPNALSLPPCSRSPRLVCTAYGVARRPRSAAARACRRTAAVAGAQSGALRRAHHREQQLRRLSASGEQPAARAWTMPYIESGQLPQPRARAAHREEPCARGRRLRVSYYQYSRVYARALSDYVRRDAACAPAEYLIKICTVPVRADQRSHGGAGWLVGARLRAAAGAAGDRRARGPRGPACAAAGRRLSRARSSSRISWRSVGLAAWTGKAATRCRCGCSLVVLRRRIGAVSTRRHGSEPDVATLAEREAASSSEAEQSDGVSAASS
jgi:hypothetical protein